MGSSNNKPDPLVLEEEHVHLICGLLAATSLTDKTEKQSQAISDIAYELGTKLAALQPCYTQAAQLKVGDKVLGWRVEEIGRRELRNELRSTLNAINKAGRDFIFAHSALSEDKDESGKENTRKRKREQFEELEGKFVELEQLKMKLKLSIYEEDEQQQSTETATTPEAKSEPSDSDSVPLSTVRTRENSTLPEQPSPTTKPSFPPTPCSPAQVKVSMPAPPSETSDSQDLITPKPASGSNAIAVARSDERRYSYTDKDGGIYKGLSRGRKQSEEVEWIGHRSTRERSQGTDIGSVFDPSRDPRRQRQRQRSVAVGCGHHHEG